MIQLGAGPGIARERQVGDAVWVVDGLFEDPTPLVQLHNHFLRRRGTHNFGGFFRTDGSLAHRNVLNWTGGNPQSPDVMSDDWAKSVVFRVAVQAPVQQFFKQAGTVPTGYEYWANISTTRTKTNFHVDRDENEDWEKCHAEGLFPELSTVVYTGPTDGIDGGELLIDRGPNALEYYRWCCKMRLSESDIVAGRESWVRVPYAFNRLVVFPGNAPHLVSPIRTENTFRGAMGVGFWNRAIR